MRDISLAPSTFPSSLPVEIQRFEGHRGDLSPLLPYAAVHMINFHTCPLIRVNNAIQGPQLPCDALIYISAKKQLPLLTQRQ